VDRETGLLAALFYIGFGDVAFAAVDARSYAFANAASTAAAFYLLELLTVPVRDSTGAVRRVPDHAERRRSAMLYGLTAALTIQFHYMYTLALLAHAVLVAYLAAHDRLSASWRELAVAAAVATILLLPAADPLISTFDSRYVIAYAPSPTLAGLLAVWSRPELGLSMLPVILLVAGLGGGVRLQLPVLGAETWVFLVAWLVLPPLAVFGVSELTAVSMFLARYYMSATAALALIVSIAVRSLDPPVVRIGCAAMYALLAILVQSRDMHVLEDWREVARLVNAEVEESTPILLNSGFIEGARVDWLRQRVRDDRRGFLAAPTAYYPMRGDVIPLPYLLDADTQAYLEYVIVPALEDVDRFVCIGRGKRTTWLRPWFDARYVPAGYAARELYQSQSVGAVVYERAKR
jgi:hypothetical protein